MNFELLPLSAALLGFACVAYKFLYNHHIIRTYTNRQEVSTAQLGSLIEARFSKELASQLVSMQSAPAEERPGRALLSDIHQEKINHVVRVLFSLLAALSLELVLLMMLQLAGAYEPDLLFIKFVIHTLVVLVTMVHPLLVVSLYVNQDLLPSLDWRSPRAVSKLASTILLCVAWYVMLNRFGAMTAALDAAQDKSFLEAKTNEIVLTGITITAVLSGVGCTLAPIQMFWTDRLPARNLQTKDARFKSLLQLWSSTSTLLTKRQQQLDALREANGGRVYNAPQDKVRLLRGSGEKILNKVQSFTSLLAFHRLEEDELVQEIESLTELRDSLFLEMQAAVSEAKSWQSTLPPAMVKLVRVFSLAFCCYCVYRIFNVLFLRLPFHYFWAESAAVPDDNEASLNKNTKDALAITIAKLIQSIGYLPMSETQLINQVSFILSGSLFVCSFQNVLTTFKSAGRILPTSTTTVTADVKGWLRNLVVSEFLAIYVIATALLIRSNLPADIAKLMLRILSLTSTASATTLEGMLVEVEFIDRWFDKIFGLTCVVTFLVLALKVFIESDNMYADGYDEEKFIEDPTRAKLS